MSLLFNGRYRTIGLLGIDAFGRVSRVERVSDGEAFALKTIHFDRPRGRDLVEREITLMRDHPSQHLVRFIESCFDDDNRCVGIVMELCDGTLLNYFSQFEHAWLLSTRSFVVFGLKYSSIRYILTFSRRFDLSTSSI